jgi:hypothetical protein
MMRISVINQALSTISKEVLEAAVDTITGHDNIAELLLIV